MRKGLRSFLISACIILALVLVLVRTLTVKTRAIKDHEFTRTVFLDKHDVLCSPAVYNESGVLICCYLARETTLFGQTLPMDALVWFTDKGELYNSRLGRDTVLQGHLLLGRPGNWDTGFYTSGKLKSAWLARNEIIQGVPCAKSIPMSMFSTCIITHFYEDGSLESCGLSSNIAIEGRSFVKGDRVSFDQTGKLKKKI